MLIGFIAVYVIITFALSGAWFEEAGIEDEYPTEFLWWPIWLLTVGLIRVLKSMKRAISEEWNK